MRIHRLMSITRAASLLLGGLALTACDPKILLGEFGDTQGEEESDSGGGTEGQSSGGTEGQSSGGTEGQSSGGSSSESQSGGDTGDETGDETGETGTTGDETGTTGTTGTTGGAEDECDAWAQDCPVGQKCAPFFDGNDGPTWDAWHCVDLDPTPVSAGETCHLTGPFNNGEDDCEIGSVCWDADLETLEGTCVALCLGSPQAPTCGSGFHCAVLNDGKLNVCLPDCDPLAQDCEADQECIPLPDTDQFICVLDAGGDEGQAFDPCEFANACDPGLMCADPASASECDPMAFGCCIPFCDVSAANSCPGVDQECLPWFEPMQAPPGKEDVGICGLAP